MSHELWTARVWIYDTLSASNDLKNLVGGLVSPRIYQDTGLQGAAYPMIQIRYISPVGGGDFYTLNFDRVWTRARFLVVAIANKASFQSIYPISKLMDTLLHRQSGTATDGRVEYCKREAPFDQPVTDSNGVEYRESGAFWEIAARAV